MLNLLSMPIDALPHHAEKARGVRHHPALAEPSGDSILAIDSMIPIGRAAAS